MMTRSLNIALVAMPFGSTRLPSIQLGILKSVARAAGHRVTVKYLNLPLAREIGWSRYERLCQQSCRLLGEWLFSYSAFGAAAPPPETFLAGEDVPAACTRLGMTPAELRSTREVLLPRFIERQLAATDWSEFDAVGFTSMFEQTCASLAMARAIRDAHPHVKTMFGGANFDGEMGAELMRAVDWIDYVVVGEADDVFPRLLAAMAGDDADDAPPLPAGVLHRKGDTIRGQGRTPTILELDRIPTPDYDEFFVESSMQASPREVDGMWTFVPFESARGCWWGAKSHCTFCGLNALGMSYRSKSPGRVLEQLEALAVQYGPHPFFAVDNILDHRYIESVFGEIQQRQFDYEFWYELKANVRPEQIRDLARGGLRWAQPGIESLNTHVLELMRKGSTEIMNLSFLKWAHYYGINVAWNVLYGFPGERGEDYARQVDLMSRIPHLPPPGDHGRIRMDRFSPYFNTPAEWGLGNVRADAAYAAVYPSFIDHERIAYYFCYDDPEPHADSVYEPLVTLVERWQAAWQEGPRPSLVYTRNPREIRFTDCRDSAPRHVLLGEVESAIYPLLGYSHQTARQLHAELSRQGRDVAPTEIDAAIEEFQDARLVWTEGERVFGLALPASPHR